MYKKEEIKKMKSWLAFLVALEELIESDDTIDQFDEVDVDKVLALLEQK